MKQAKAPLTRENYLFWMFGGKPPGQIDPEVEEMLPPQFRLPEPEPQPKTPSQPSGA